MKKKMYLILVSWIISNKTAILSTDEIQKKYFGLIHFIHEFHHFLEINENTQNIRESPHYKLYCIARNGNNYHKASGIYNVQPIPLPNPHADKIQKLKFYLSGYAAESAYRNHFYLLQVYNKSSYDLFLDNLLLLLYYHHFHHKIKDIEFALEITKKIDYTTLEVSYYLNKYQSEIKDNPYFIKIKNLYKNNTNEIILLYGIYKELVEKYSQKNYYDKLYNIIKNNPEIFTMEIFFLNDLQSLWQKEKLSRQLNRLDSYSLSEIKIMENIQNIDSLQKRKDFFALYENKTDLYSLYYHYQKTIKNKITDTVRLLHNKGKSFYQAISNFIS